MGKGLYREKHGWGDQDSARVRYSDGKELDVDRGNYEAGGHEPDFDTLPTKAEYEKRDANGA